MPRTSITVWDGRRTRQCALLVAVVALLAAATTSAFRSVRYNYDDQGSWIGLDCGCLRVTWPGTMVSIARYPGRGLYIWPREGPLASIPSVSTGPSGGLASLPLWVPIAALLFLVGRASRHSVARHSCIACKYDRRGIPPNSPCPECGHTP